MNDNVVELHKPEPHWEGIARCLNCKHVAVAVAPVGLWVVDCPNCKTTAMYPEKVLAKKGLHYTCHCGCQFFNVTPDGIYCPHCAAETPFEAL